MSRFQFRMIPAGVVPATVVAATLLLAACERPPVETVQRGYRGLAMVEVNNPRLAAVQVAAHQLPEAIAPVAPGSPPASSIFKNVQVLGNLDVAEFTRTMIAMTAWVSPKEGCAYCHEGADLASDSLYTKVVARRMLQMTRDVNMQAKAHVAETGVTCWTCHRGQPVPANAWQTDPGPQTALGPAGNRAGQNSPAMTVGLTSLPFDPFTPFLGGSKDIRVVGTAALTGLADNRHSIKETEWTYGLMMHMSQSLGVNCTYCHNSRSFASWDASTPQRATAWHGIRMVRDLNARYLEPLASTLPAARLGPAGDPPKVNCATCHQGLFKPLYGAAMAKDYPGLIGPTGGASAAPAAAPAAAPNNAPAPTAQAQPQAPMSAGQRATTPPKS